jgi:3',5'-cyclic AMP phosphodiesterase CpdA
MIVVQVTDTHIKPRGRLAYRRVDSAAALAACVDHINELAPSPDVVLFTGDLVDAGSLRNMPTSASWSNRSVFPTF